VQRSRSMLLAGRRRRDSSRGDATWRLLLWRAHELRALTVAVVLAMGGWLVRIVDLDLFSPDSAADLEIDLYAAAALTAAYALFLIGVRLLSQPRAKVHRYDTGSRRRSGRQ
jgi:hypothetical protein